MQSELNGNILKCLLKGKNGKVQLNELELHPLFANISLGNEDGWLTYRVSREENAILMQQLYPAYAGASKTIHIDEGVILSIDTPKYNRVLKKTQAVLAGYKLPEVRVHLGYDATNYRGSRFDGFVATTDKPQIAMGMLDIFEAFALKHSGSKDAWLLYLENDARPINVERSENMKVLLNVPEDAELIRPFVGKNQKYVAEKATYQYDWGGGLAHAFYISAAGCQKVVAYALKYKWKYVCDIDIYKLAKRCPGYPSGFDGWSFRATNGVNAISSVLEEDEKIRMYGLSENIFDQASNPLTYI